MKKILTLLLCVCMILSCLTGCGKQEADLNARWGMTPEQAAEAYGVILADAQVEEGAQTFYTFADAKVFGTPCELKLVFESLDDQATPYLQACYYTFASEADYNRVLGKLEKLDGYTEIGGQKGFFDTSKLTAEQLAWLDKYTTAEADDNGGIRYAVTEQLENGGVQKIDSYLSEGTPLVTLSEADGEVYRLFLNDRVFYALAEQDAYEALYPDGMPRRTLE